MTKYRAIADGVTVFETTTDGYQGFTVFPVECRQPESGVVELWVDDELIGTQRPVAVRTIEDLEAALAAARAAQGGT